MRKREYLIAAPLALLVSTSIAYTDMLICGVPAPIARLVAVGTAMVGVVLSFPLVRSGQERSLPKEEPMSHYDE